MNSINQFFKDYLEKSGLDPRKLSEVQLTETKRAFFAGAGVIFKHLTDVVESNPDTEEGDEESSKTFTAIHDEIYNFWREETSK